MHPGELELELKESRITIGNKNQLLHNNAADLKTKP
jgi:hypothetical protein